MARGISNRPSRPSARWKQTSGSSRRWRRRAGQGATRLNRGTRRWLRRTVSRTRRQGKRTFKATFRRIRQKNKLIRVRMKARRRAITAQRKLLDRVRAIVAKAKVKTLAQAANLVRRAARSLVRYRKSRKVAAAAGQPPFTHSQRLKKAILYAVSGKRAVIGPSRRIIGIVGGVHERGGTYKGDKFAARPFMGPAMAEAAEKIPRVWRRNLRA